MMVGVPLSLTGLSCELCDRDAKGSEAVQDGDTDLEPRNLTVKVPRHAALAQQFHAVFSSQRDIHPASKVNRDRNCTKRLLTRS